MGLCDLLGLCLVDGPCWENTDIFIIQQGLFSSPTILVMYLTSLKFIYPKLIKLINPKAYNSMRNRFIVCPVSSQDREGKTNKDTVDCLFTQKYNKEKQTKTRVVFDKAVGLC